MDRIGPAATACGATLVAVSLGLGACSGTKAVPPDAAAPIIMDAAVPDATPRQLGAFPPEVKSLELRRSMTVLKDPSDDSVRVGTLAAGARVRWRTALKAPGCKKRWIEIEPFGWVCERHFRRSTKPPTAHEYPRIERNAIVPSTYGKVSVEDPLGAQTYSYKDGVLTEKRRLVGSVTMRKYGEITVDEKRYWRIGRREYLAASDMYEHRPSSFGGKRLGDDTGWTLPMGFATNDADGNHKVTVWSKARGGKWLGRLERRAPVKLLETVTDGKGKPFSYRIAEGKWVRAKHVRVARRSEPPPTTGLRERWFDVYLDRQVLVAYEGKTAVYTTLVSSGQRKYRTPTGIYRVFVKFAETAMSGQMGEATQPYSVATVPWTQYYAKDFALHTAYWHDHFGIGVSHGCVNLAPRDSRFLYFWSEPVVPPGWSMAHGTPAHPGSMVRVRSDDDPDPAFQGYAKEVYKARLKAAGKRAK